MTFHAATAVVDIRRHKSRGDTIKRHSSPYFIVQATTSKSLAGFHVLVLPSRSSKYFNYPDVSAPGARNCRALGLVALLATDNRIVEIPRAFSNVEIKTAP